MAQFTPSSAQADQRGVQFLPSRREAEQRARACEADAERFEGRLPHVAADKRAEADRLRNPAAHMPAGQRVLVDTDRREPGGLHVVGEDGRLHRAESVKATRARRQFVEEFERFAKLTEPEKRAYQALGRVRQQRSRCAARSRRTPTARPAARRPRRRSGASSSTASSDPGDADGEPEPPRSAAHRVALAWLEAGAHLLGEEPGR